MAYEGTIKCVPGAVCGAVSMATKQFCCVVLNGDNTWEVANANGESAWILQNAPAANEPAEVAYSGVTKALVGGTGVTVGSPVQSHTDGTVEDALADAFCAGFALETAAAGVYAKILLCPCWNHS